MKGKIRILVSTKRLRYELNLRRNITIIQGDSASGKTTLIQIISDYLSGRTGPGTEVICDRKCAVLSGDPESACIRLSLLQNAVVFVDEQETFLSTKSFARAVLASNCYFVFITLKQTAPACIFFRKETFQHTHIKCLAKTARAHDQSDRCARFPPFPDEVVLSM